jgi:hypothetical protein
MSPPNVSIFAINPPPQKKKKKNLPLTLQCPPFMTKNDENTPDKNLEKKKKKKSEIERLRGHCKFVCSKRG